MFTKNIEYMLNKLENNIPGNHNKLEQNKVIKLFTAFLIIKKLLSNQNNVDSWNNLASQADIAADIIRLAKQISAANPEYYHLISRDFELIKGLKLFNNPELFIIYTMVNLTDLDKSDGWLAVLLSPLNDHAATDITDKLIAYLIHLKYIDVCNFGFRIGEFLNISHTISNYFIESYQAQEALLCSLFTENTQAITNYNYDFIQSDSDKKYDVVLLSANHAHEKPDNPNLELLSTSNSSGFWHKPIAESNLKYLHIRHAIDLLNDDGRLFLSIRQKQWQQLILADLREYLITNNLISHVIYVKTNRADPRVLIIIAKKNPYTNKIFFISDKFYTNQGLKYELNNFMIDKIAATITNEEESKDLSGFISTIGLKQFNYTLDPTVCFSLQPHLQSNSQSIKLGEISNIYRGPNIYNRDFADLAPGKGYYIVGHSALEEDGLNLTKLTPIPASVYKDNSGLYAIYPGDLLILSRSTSNRVVMVPKDIPKIIVNSNIIVIRPYKHIADPFYLNLLFNSDYGKALIGGIEKGTILKSISIRELKELDIILKLMAEQKSITDEFAQKLYRFEQAKSEFAAALNRIEAMLP